MAGLRKTLTPTAAARMQQALQRSPQSLDDLVLVSGLSKPVVTRYVRELYEAEQRLVHVAKWARDSRGYPTIRMFAWGDAPDAKCPVSTRTATERMRDLRAERKRLAS